jgi:hypothetical protein
MGEAQGKKVDPSAVAAQAIEAQLLFGHIKPRRGEVASRAEQHSREKTWRTSMDPRQGLGFYILDAASWRGWDGKDFTVTFVDPYRGPVANPQSHVCAIVLYVDYADAIAFHPASHLFVATLWNQGSGVFGPKASIVHWSRPALALTENQMLRREPLGAGKWSYGYFSLIDPNAADASFMTITDHPYMYYVRIDDYGDLRILFRQRVKLGWLAALHPAAGASGGASAGKP